MSNRLIDETSPYLLQHAQNPVDWYPWSEEAFSRAREEDKPIFLSVGYAACHWCHVMAHESFEDPETAAIMNEYFINIKVDREERPDIDSIYMDAVVAMTGQGGWPMSVFLTPDGHPFHGGTYYPPASRYGMPSFSGLLEAVAEAWREDRERILEQGSILRDHIARTPVLSSEDNLDPEVFNRAAEALFKQYDWKFGGWGTAPKFPQASILEFLFRQYDRNEDKLALEMATHALRSMANGGMYDLIGGGFHRYSVDDQWLVPHFEKMLYDNALLTLAYLHGWQITGEEFFREIAQETLDFLMREMLDSEGGFYSSLDADSEGEEGTYYIWTLEELNQVIEDPRHRNLLIDAYGFTKNGNFEGKNIPFRAMSPSELSDKYDLTEDEINQTTNELRKRFLEARDNRIRPGLDDKVLTSWNGLLLMTLSTAARILDDEAYLKSAQRLAEFLLEKMHRDGKLMRSWRSGKANYTAYLEDHAALGLGLIELYQVDFNLRWYNAAIKQTEEILGHFRDLNGGFFDTRDDHDKLISRPKTLQDSPIPSGNSMAALLLLQLGALTGENKYIEPALEALRAMQENAGRHPSAFSWWLCAIDFALGPQLQLALVGDPSDEEFHNLANVTYGQFLPRLVIAGGIPSSGAFPTLLHGRKQIDEAPTAYLCQGFACKLPTKDPEELESQIMEAESPKA
ncbi:MAG: DUF255 domain-containing protein [Anaerolineales bacterium]|nr:DUF255 domain-containing protein [Anaerolineales bacterium]